MDWIQLIFDLPVAIIPNGPQKKVKALSNHKPINGWMEKWIINDDSVELIASKASSLLVHFVKETVVSFLSF
jgi:hypothetical protein